MREIPAELRDRYLAQGWWTNDTLGDLLARGLAGAPDAELRVHSAVRPYRGSFAEVEHTARRLAAGLRARGVGPGDVVAFRLPNWMEAAATFWASALLGAVVVPIVHFYGRKELTHIFADARPKAFITAERFGRMVFEPELSAGIPVVAVVDGDSPSFDDLLADEPLDGVLPVDPASRALIAYTSGTTSAPKGVMHSHHSLVCETRQLAGLFPPDRGNQLTAAPVGHFIGMVNALLIPVLDGHADQPRRRVGSRQALSLMRTDELHVGGGATYFITTLLDHPDFTPEHLPTHAVCRARRFVGAGRRHQRLNGLGVTVFRSYGSTEHPSITGSAHTAPRDKRLFTDGSALPGVEVRLADDGEILSRGPDLCLGYTDDALTAKAFDGDGWYHTGDVGDVRRGRLPVHHRPQVRHHHPWRREHQRHRSRGRAAGRCPVSPRPPWWPCPTTASANAPRRCCGCSRVPNCPPSTRAGAFRNRRRRPPEVARAPVRRRRLPAHGERQGAEVQGARADPRAHCHDDGVRI